MEEFAPGREYSIEYVSWQGEHHFLACTEKFTTGAPLFVETGHLQPPLHMDAGLLSLSLIHIEMCIRDRIEAAITPRTRVIVPVHYAGVACEMDTIMDIARRHGLKVVEDAAQGVMSTYKGRALGTIGDMGCFSFHETKNYSCLLYTSRCV